MRMKVMLASVLCLLVSSSILYAGPPTLEKVTSFRIVSRTPQYVKIAVTEDGKSITAVMFDESAGTGKGYDLVYVDVDHTGKFKPDYKLTTELKNYSGTRYGGFQAVNLAKPYSPKYAKDLTNFGTLSFNIYQYQEQKNFGVMLNVNLKDGVAVWNYMANSYINPAATIEQAPLIKIDGKQATLNITVKPDLNKKGQTGFGLTLATGIARADCTKNGVKPAATITVTDQNGKTVHTATEALDKFAFG